MSHDDLIAALRESAESWAHEVRTRKLAADAIAALVAERDALRADAELCRWLRELKCNSLSLTRDDDHAANYMTAAEWIDEHADLFRGADAAEVQRMKDANTIWSLQVYPHTPIGFDVWHGATLDAAIDAARAAQEQGR
jgi:hypothetical protein